MKGIISAMGISRDGVLAAGTFSGNVGLYDGRGRGGTLGVITLRAHRTGKEERGLGVTQVFWSDCGRYLCVAERCSDGVGVWDIRGTGQRLAWLKGRRAETQQRMGIEVVGGNVWAGGLDGFVRVWEGLGMEAGSIEPNSEFKAHDDVVSSVAMHPSSDVLLTCSGQRHWSSAQSKYKRDIEIQIDNSMKIWTI